MFIMIFKNVAFGYWGFWANCWIGGLDSLTNSVLKSHPADVHVYKDIQNVAFDYLGNWGDCQICDLDSVKSNVLKSHSVDEHVLN